MNKWQEFWLRWRLVQKGVEDKWNVNVFWEEQGSMRRFAVSGGMEEIVRRVRQGQRGRVIVDRR